VTDRGTYIKMSDSLPEHRKIVVAGGDAGWLHICALAYASRNRTDGFLPAAYLPQLSDRKQPMKLAARLCDVNLWHAPGHECKKCPQPQPGEYVIHDYLEHQRSAAKIAEVSEKRATAGRTGGSRSKPKAKQIASGLFEPGFASAEANGTPDTEGVLRTPQAEADTDDQQASPAAAGKPRLTVTQRSKRITDAYAEAEPMCKWPAVNGVVIKAINSKRFTDEEIRDALLRMAAENRSVTVDSLRTELGGLPPRTGASPPKQTNYTDEEYASGWK
jgi:hypothetical protein